MSIDIILLELLIGAMVLGFIGAYKKRIFDRVILLITVPVAFFASVFLTKSVLFNNAVDMILELGDLQSAEGMTESIFNLIRDIGAAVAGPIVATVLFWVLLFLLRILVGIILFIIHTVTGCRHREKKAKKAWRAAKKEGKDPAEEEADKPLRKRYKKPLWHKLTTGAIGAVSGFLIIMFSMLPLVYINNLVEPAVETALAKENEGTYVNELAVMADEKFMPLSDKTVFGKIRKYTGMKALTNATLKSITDVKVEFGGDAKLEFNVVDVVSTLANESVTAAAIYERSCESTGTFKDLGPISSILTKIADNKPIMNVCATFYREFYDILIEDSEYAYKIESADDLKRDVTAAAGIIDILATDLADVSLESEDILTEILDYLKNEESSEKFVGVLAQSKVYETYFPVLMEYALELICNQLALPENKAEDYRGFISDMMAACNDKSAGAHEADRVEAFIEYCVINNVIVSNYTPNGDTPSENDKNYYSYLNFMQKREGIENAFIDRGLDDGTKLSFYLASDGNNVYVYYDILDMWKLHDNEALRKSSYAAQLLADQMISAGSDGFTEDALKNAALICAAKTNANDITINANTLLLLSAICDEASYEPSDPVYRENIVASLNKDAEHTKEHNDSFASVLATMAHLYTALTEESDEASIDTVVENFGLVGRMLDDMKKMESTAAIPDMMVKALQKNKNYGMIFATQTAKDLIKQVEDGKETYEGLFNQLIPIYLSIKDAVQ